MKITPVKRYRTPNFPIHEVLKKHPELLRLVPKRWANSPLVLSALAFACLILASRAEAAETAWDETGFDEASIEQTDVLCDVPGFLHDRCEAGSRVIPEAGAKNQRIAPIFQHGSGRGSYGCQSTASPVFLTEDEARKVIREETVSAGLRFEFDVKTLEAVETPLAARQIAHDDTDRRTNAAKVRTHRDRLVMDGTDQMRNISFEFVSRQDFRNWDFGYYSYGGIETIDIRYTAEVLRHNLTSTETEDTGVVGVFYDPVHYASPRNNRTAASARKASINDLKKQVRDFIAWLKAEGII